MTSKRSLLDRALRNSPAMTCYKSTDRNGETVVFVEKCKRSTVSSRHYRPTATHRFLGNTTPSLSARWKNNSSGLSVNQRGKNHEVVKVRKIGLGNILCDYFVVRKLRFLRPVCIHVLFYLLLNRLSVRMVLLRKDEERNSVIPSECGKVNIKKNVPSFPILPFKNGKKHIDMGAMDRMSFKNRVENVCTS